MHQNLRERQRKPLVCDGLRLQRSSRRAAQSGRAVPSGVAVYASSALSGAQSSRQLSRANASGENQAEKFNRVRQQTHPAPFRARRAVGSRTRAHASCSQQVGRAVPSRAAAYASSALSGAQSSRQPHTSERLPRKSSRKSIAVVCGSVRIQRPFGRAEQSAAAHERTPPRKSSRKSIAVVCGSVHIQRPFGRAERSATAHERTRPRKSSRQSIAVVSGSVRIQRPFGRAEQSAAAHERTSQVR